MIPENAFLFCDTLVFKKDGNYVYIVSSSSLSNDIPWKDLQIVIEFEDDVNSCWKRICQELQVQHAFVKVGSLALKTLQEIKQLNLIQDANKNIISFKSSILLFVSDAVTAQNEILYSLESKSDIILCEKRYKKILPHIYFADVTIDEKTAVILVDQSEFCENNTLHNTINRVEHLHLKYDVCWIIVKEFKHNIDISLRCRIRENIMLFSCAITNFCQKIDSYQVKILFASKTTDIADFIKHISSVVYRNKKNTFDYKPSSQSEITEKEIFLASFPSLNPYTVCMMVSSTTITHLLNMSCFQLCQKFFTVPQRFLKYFYSTVHKTFRLTENPVKENIYKSLKNLKNNPGNIEGKNVVWEPNRDNTEINFLSLSSGSKYQSVHFPGCSEIDIFNSLQESSDFKPNNKVTYLNTHEKTLEEIDRDYLSLSCTVAPHNLNIAFQKSENKIKDDYYSYSDDEHHSYSDKKNSSYEDEEHRDEENCRYREEELCSCRDKGNSLPCTSSQCTQNSILAESVTEFPFAKTREVADVRNCTDNNFNIFDDAETTPLDITNSSIFIDKFCKRDKENKNLVSPKLVNHCLTATKIGPETGSFDNDKITSLSQTDVKKVLNLKQFSYMPRKKLKSENNNSVSPKLMSSFSNTKISPKNGSFHNDEITSPSQTSAKKVFNQKEFLYMPRKKLKSSDHVAPKDHNMLSCSPSSPLEKSFRIQKGVFSKTVEKQDLANHISVKSDISAFDNSLNGFEVSNNPGILFSGPIKDLTRTKHEFCNTEVYSENDFFQLSVAASDVPDVLVAAKSGDMAGHGTISNPHGHSSKCYK
ncbi:uncharacterized protein LOC118204075 isoform X2 [Stegodyphus dumicola]|uniref:uncharacterized protein LOC118204075 isoform X2 n=1 Tax=Stegodyphus dumicola TaxID=202533 RepID=UPI0015A7E425|nr:uncharacterized protein LOC118204075 isoform X2 [Stegodyphus dumicola]